MSPKSKQRQFLISSFSLIAWTDTQTDTRTDPDRNNTLLQRRTG